jgi:glucokinase
MLRNSRYVRVGFIPWGKIGDYAKKRITKPIKKEAARAGKAHAESLLKAGAIGAGLGLGVAWLVSAIRK